MRQNNHHEDTALVGTLLPHPVLYHNLLLTLAKLCIQLMLSQPRQDNSQMLCMICLILRVNQDIIDKHDNELVKLGPEHRIHQVHE